MPWNPFSSDLTDNFKANLILTPVSLFIYYLTLNYFHERFRIELNWSLTVSFTAIYIYASRFYQPDLDHRTNRPGKAHFPFGKKISVFLMGSKGGLSSKFLIVISIFQIVCAKVWFWYWKPFTLLVTHRGATHIPVFGTFFRSLYVYLGVKFLIALHIFISSELIQLGHSGKTKIVSIILISLGEVPLDKILIPSRDFFKSMSLLSGICPYFATYCLPIYIADIIHEAVDMYDSVRRGKGYCSTPSSEWGIVKRIFPRLPF
jgi:uncharacterized metal-binding protein